MRLTLRTLLAYLDDTLEEQDAETIRVKLAESGFATQLVQRIRGALANREISGLPPDSVHPISEANMMSEYLDSTLSPEQVAEIERACLESGPHLAEAAACHQILTMALGQPAETSDDLRARVYEIGVQKSDRGTANTSFSALDIPASGPPPIAAPPEPGTPSDDIETLDAPVASSEVIASRPSSTVKPVGAGDSGVYDAVTRMRNSGVIEENGEPGGPAMAGIRSRERLEKSDLYGGTVRTSRITPWLVSLALAGALLFSISQIFGNLFQKPVAKNQEEKISSVLDGPEKSDAEEIVVPAEKAPPMESIGTPGVNLDGQVENASGENGNSPNPSAEVLPAPASAVVDQTSDTSSDNDDAIPATVEPPKSDEMESPAAPVSDVPRSNSTEPKSSADLVSPGAGDSAKQDEDTEPNGADTTGLMAQGDAPAGDTVPPKAPVNPSVPKIPDENMVPDANPAAEPAASPPIAKLLDPKTFVVIPDSKQQWKRVAPDASVPMNTPVVCAPEFRANLEVGDYKISLVGPTEIAWTDDQAAPTVQLIAGHAVIETTKPNITLAVEMAGIPAVLSIADAGTRVGISSEFERRRGMDPLEPQNHQVVASVMAINNNVSVQANGGDNLIPMGSKWMAPENEPAQTLVMQTAATWLDPESEQPGSLDAQARESLLTLINDKPLMVALREALSFRQDEVGALAAKTMLSLGAGDVYFGADGIFNRSRQRSHWEGHFKAIRNMVDRDPATAQAILDSIIRVDAADAKKLFQLLTGFTNNQLTEGADQDLIDDLDSTSMPVRVLAIENLRDITGTTLYYRAEEDNPNRRVSVIKKWSARQRKGDIRLSKP